MLHSFDLSHEERGTSSAMRVAGDLDIAAAPHFRQMVRDLMGAGVREMTVDLADTSFVDSSGLGALLWAEHRLRAVGGHFEVTHPNDQVARIIAMAGLEGILIHH